MADKPESVRGIPTTNYVRDPELRRILDAIVQVIRFLESRPATTVVAARDWDGRNVGEGMRVLAGKRGGDWAFRTLRVDGDGLSIAEVGDTILIRLNQEHANASDDDSKVAADSSDSDPGYLDEKLVNVGSDTGAVALLAGVASNALNLRKLLGDGSFIQIGTTEGGSVKIEWKGDDVTGFSDELSQLAGHASGAPALFDIVTSIGTPGADDSIPTEKAVRDAIQMFDDEITAEANTTSVTVVTAWQYDTSSKKFQYKTRTMTLPTAWIGSESGWTDAYTASTFSCPS